MSFSKRRYFDETTAYLVGLYPVQTVCPNLGEHAFSDLKENVVYTDFLDNYWPNLLDYVGPQLQEYEYTNLVTCLIMHQ